MFTQILGQTSIPIFIFFALTPWKPSNFFLKFYLSRTPTTFTLPLSLDHLIDILNSEMQIFLEKPNSLCSIALDWIPSRLKFVNK